MSHFLRKTRQYVTSHSRGNQNATVPLQLEVETSVQPLSVRFVLPISV